MTPAARRRQPDGNAARPSPLHPAGAEPGTPPMVERARAHYAGRRARDRQFGNLAHLFGEPSWDVLLDLYVARHEGRRVSVSSACLATMVAQSTAMRWLSLLHEGGLTRRLRDPADRRRQFVQLTPRGVELVERALVHF